MGRRAEGYVRKEITISRRAAEDGDTEIWKCEICGRWHGFYESGTTEDNGVCDECWAAWRIENEVEE